MNSKTEDVVRAKFFIVMFCLLLLPSCTKRYKCHQPITHDVVIDNCYSKNLAIVVQQEAMLVDISIPFYNERIIPVSCDISESDTLVFGYRSPLSCTQAIDFFNNQMERSGWKHLVSFNGVETIMQFASPNRYCTIVIKNSTLPLNSDIFIYIKRASIHACS
ncbi:MAG TPA: hypothetical protein VLB80_04500 [Candidatus Babeliales bacterium]|nr:hypothetical protein [Candidatus Babeliales bacterium]